MTLTTKVTAKDIIIDIIDDGQGFDVDLPHSGFGLRGMRERVQLLGGELRINSIPNKGTHLQIAIVNSLNLGLTK